MKNKTTNIFLLAYLIVLNIANGYAQENSGCFTKYQLLRMQSTSLGDIRVFLNNEGWSFDGGQSNQSYNYFNYPIKYNIVSWEKSYYNGGNIILYNYPGKPNIVIYQVNSNCFNDLLKSFTANKTKTTLQDDKLVTIVKQNAITIEFREYKNDYSSRKYSVLVYNSVALFRELEVLKQKEEALKKAELEKKIIYNDAITAGDKLFLLKKYDEAKLKYFIAKEIEANEILKAKIEACDDAICEKITTKGDSLYAKNDYEEALKVYIQAKNCSNSFQLPDKIKTIERKILDNKIKSIQDNAAVIFNEKKYDLAINSYQSILLLDKSNPIALEKINEIQKIKNILNKRSSTTFSYKNINESEFLKFKNELVTNLNSQINTNKEGFLKFSYHIAFDTLGTNISSYDKLTTTVKDYPNYLANLAKNDILKPSSEGGYFLASEENLDFDIKWESQKIAFESNSKGIFQVDYSEINAKSIESYINKQNFKYGKYTFEVKSKVANSSVFNDIKLVKYKTAGPGSVIYSMIMPGMGMLRVSHGEKGWGRFASFILSSGIAIGSKLYSNSQYKNYLNATNQIDIDKYYNTANISHQISLISGGISALIYVNDIIGVLSKGAKNKKQSKFLKKQLQNSPVIIEQQPIK